MLTLLITRSLALNPKPKTRWRLSAPLRVSFTQHKNHDTVHVNLSAL
jgi:hypothetical protein